MPSKIRLFAKAAAANFGVRIALAIAIVLAAGLARLAFNLSPGARDQFTQSLSSANSENIDRWRTAIAERPDDVNAWMALGNALAYSGEVDEAVAAYERAVELCEAQQDCKRHRAMVLAELERVRGSIATEDGAR